MSSFPDQHRSQGRSNRSNRAQADNDIFEGLPVKQWGSTVTHISLAPKPEIASIEDKWGDLPMPRDYQLLQPWTQHLLRLARSGKAGTKRKHDPDSTDEEKPDDEVAEESVDTSENRGYVVKKWKPVPESLLHPEHKHFEFLAKRRKGLPSLYGPEIQNGTAVAMRKTKVQRIGTDGENTVYEVLVPEGQAIEGEITVTAELADVKSVAAAPGTFIEGIGIANDEGVLVAEHLKPATGSRRNRPPPKKKMGPGRGKKRVTFTNPDGSTYTTIVPNATKIVTQPGQTVKHLSKGDDTKLVDPAQSAEQTTMTTEESAVDEAVKGEEEVSDDGGDEDDDREEGEVSEDDESSARSPPVSPEKVTPAVAPKPAIKLEMSSSRRPSAASSGIQVTAALSAALSAEAINREASSSPDLPLVTTSQVQVRRGSTRSPLATTVQTVGVTDTAVATDAPAGPPEEESIEVIQLAPTGMNDSTGLALTDDDNYKDDNDKDDNANDILTDISTAAPLPTNPTILTDSGTDSGAVALTEEKEDDTILGPVDLNPSQPAKPTEQSDVRPSSAPTSENGIHDTSAHRDQHRPSSSSGHATSVDAPPADGEPVLLPVPVALPVGEDEVVATLPDDEEDLLGSLEKSLGKTGAE